MRADERKIIRIEHRTFDVKPGQRVRPVEDVKRNLCPRVFLHRIKDCGFIRVKPDTNILNKKYQCSAPAQHFGGGPEGLAVQPPALDPGGGMDNGRGTRRNSSNLS